MGFIDFFSKLGTGLRNAAPAIQHIGDSLVEAGGSPLQQQSLQARQQLGLQRQQLGMQQQVQQSGLDTAALQRQHLGQEISAFETPDQKDAAALKQNEAIQEQNKALAPPTDIVAPLGPTSTDGYGHFERSYNPQTKQYHVSPTMVDVTKPNPTQNAGIPPSLIGPVIPPAPQVSGRQQLMATPKAGGAPRTEPTQLDSATKFDSVWYDPTGHEIGRQPNALAPAGFIESNTDGNNTVLKQDEHSNWVAINEPHSSKKTPVVPVLPSRNTNRSALAPPQANGAAPVSNSMPAIRPNPRAKLGPTATPVLDSSGNPLHAPLSADGKKTLKQVSTSDQMLNSIMPDLTAAVNDIGHGSNIYDAVKTRASWLEYNKGLDPNNIDPNSPVSALPGTDPRITKIFPAIAMMKVVLAQPFLSNSRNFMFMQQIQQHIPDPEKDTPQLMLSKAQWIQKSLPMIKNAVYESEGITTKPNQSTGSPQNGEVKKFPNGKTGIWDGTGWVAQ